MATDRRGNFYEGARGADGSLTPMNFVLPQEPEIQMGGHGLYATIGDYMRFIRCWLNDGAGENGRAASFTGYMDFETAAYKNLAKKAA
jgi:hypothetical protein